MRHGIVLFTSDRGITPAQAAMAAEERGFDAFYVPEHTHIPVKREAPHPRTGDGTLPDDRYKRTLDPWVALATAAVVTSRIRSRRDEQTDVGCARPVPVRPRLPQGGGLAADVRPPATSPDGRRPASPSSSGGCRTPRGRWWRATSTASRTA